MKTITKSNKKIIMVYYSLTLTFVIIGIYINEPRWYVIAVTFLLLAFFRKYRLIKNLKK